MTDVKLSLSEKKKHKNRTPKAELDTKPTDIDTLKDFLVKPQSFTPSLDISEWPILLKNYDRLNVRTEHYTLLPSNFSSLKCSLAEYIRYDVLNLDKPVNRLSARTSRGLNVFLGLKKLVIAVH